MKNETKTIIRNSIREFFSDIDTISKYRVNKIIQTEIEHPIRWGAGDEYDNSEDACIQRYYSNINSRGAQNILVHWINNLHSTYNIYYNTTLQAWRDPRSVR